MTFRERLKKFKEKSRLVVSSNLPPTPNDQTPSPNLNPTSTSLSTPNAPGPSGHGSAPQSGGQTTADNGWASLKGLLEILGNGASASGPLKIIIDDLFRCLCLHEDAAAVRRDHQTLKIQLDALFNDLSNHFSGDVPPVMTASMDNICNAIEREMDQISTKDERRAWRRHYEAKKDLDDILECYRRIYRHLERLTLNANLSTWKIVDKQATEAQLDRLAPSMSACYNSAEAALVRRRECTPKTREQVLADLSIWRHDKKQGNMYWLNGMAGTGKTTIANSLCAMLDRSHELGASFFCTRLLPECRRVKLILPTIAYQLARFSRPFRCALSRVLERDPDVHTKALPNQLECMIIGPLREVAHTLPTEFVVVIDGLDECEDSDGVEVILSILARHASELPLKVFVSSRPEPQIRDKIGHMKAQLVLHELDESVVKEDIETYLRVELEGISVSESELAALVERSGILFIYAATVVRYISAQSFHLG